MYAAVRPVQVPGLSVLEVTMEEAKRFGILNVEADDQVYEFEEKPPQPKSNLASMGIYVFTWSKLRKYLIDDEADPNSSNALPPPR